MKKLISIFLILLGFYSTFFAHEEPTKTLAEKKQKEKDRKFIQSHKTKTATIWNYKISDDGIKTDIKTKNVVSSYDKHGNLAEVNIFKNDSVDTHLVFQRDDENNMIAEIGYDINNNITEKISYIYDEEGRIQKQLNYINEKDLVSKFTYSLNYENNMVLFKKTKPDSTLDYYITYTYNGNPDSAENTGIIKLSPEKDTLMIIKNCFDENKLRIKKEIYDNNQQLRYYFQYKYLAGTDNISDISQLSPDGTVMSIIQYKYNKEEQISEILSYNDKNVLVSCQEFSYEKFPNTH